MSTEPVKGHVRVLLLDNAWPYDTSANFLRLHALGQLLRRLPLKNDGDTIAGLFEAFDLVVARDTPFIRHFCRILSSFASSYRWSYLFESDIFDEAGDSQFKGYRSHPQRGVLRRLRTHTSNKVLLLNTHDRSRSIERSYLVSDGHSQKLHELLSMNLSPRELDLYTKALSCELSLSPLQSGRSAQFYPLILLAKSEAQLLYPNHRIVIVELNSLLGPGSESFQFTEWFGQTQGEDLSNAASELRGTFPSTSKALKVEADHDRELVVQTRISNFQGTLREVSQANIGYRAVDLEEVEYHNLTFDPRQLLRSRSIQTIRSMMQDLSNSRRLWELMTPCIQGLRVPVGPTKTPSVPFPFKTPIKSERPLRLLAFDGGGVRGLSSLLILQKILERIKKECDLATTPLPCEYFDMIAGTSTGGLIAILLGRLRLSVYDCIKLYEEVGQDIFGVEQSITASTRFSSKRFKNVLQKRIEDILNVSHEDIYLQDPEIANGNGCPIFVVTIERDRVAEPEGAILLRSYEVEKGVNFEESCYLWEAALATCSAPIFFSPAQVKDKVLVDGGLGHNNPAEHLIHEAKERWPERQIGAVVSIGTGKARGNLLARDMKRSAAGKHPVALIHVAKVLKHIATSSEARERSVFNYFLGMNKLDSYFRFNVDTGMEIELHEYKKYDEIRYHTQKHLDAPGVKERLVACARKLERQTADQMPSFQPVSQTRNTSRQEFQASGEVLDQLDDEIEELNLLESESLQQLVDLSSPVLTHLNPLYQLEVPLDSSRARITPLEEISKTPVEAIVEHKALDWNSTKRRQTNVGEIRPISGTAYAIDTNSPESKFVVDYEESGLERKIEPGLWRLHWLLLFCCFDIGSHDIEAEAEGTGSEEVERVSPSSIPVNVPQPVRDSTNPSKPESPKPAQIQLSVDYESKNGNTTKLNTAAILGADIPYPARNFLDEQWQAIAMDGLLSVEHMNQQPNLSFCLDFSGWDEATSKAGTKHTWTIYFGGIRLTPVNEANV